MEVRVQGTDMDPSQCDPRDWTQVLRAQANLRETRNATHGTNADPSVRETLSQSRETPQTCHNSRATELFDAAARSPYNRLKDQATTAPSTRRI
ncbi:hypothetical protein MRX96_039311 [Rhipicephalus microplus]